jgi:N-acetylmuramoyl-L-alanine amidase
VNLKGLRGQVHIQQKNITRFIKERRTVKALHVFRNYSALIVVISCALLVSATNLAAGKETSGFLFGYFGNSDNYENPLADKMSLQTNKKADLALVQLAQASTAPDPTAKEDDTQNQELVMQGQALVAGTGPVRKDPEEDGGVKIYEVESGDTVSSIAAKNNITVNTILWANNLDNVDSIMPGDKIFILPVAGLSYTVKSGDDLDSIAKKYKTDKDKIIAYNDLPANGDIKEGQEIILPDAEKEVPKPPVVSSGPSIATRQYESFETPGKSTLSEGAGDGHDFPYGYCTWYVAQKRYIPWSGNAGTWLYHAKSMGYATSRTPSVGSIMVSSESWWGHVAIVEKVNKDGTFVISEMNYKGWGKKDFRTIDASSRVIKGFIK